MRILHTADWHLGHTLRDHSQEAEHVHFLGWLVQTVVARRVDVLLIAGDVFDTANPPPAAWRLWFQFLGELKRERPEVQVVVIAGNHDSAARLEAPRDLLAAFDVRVVGSVVRGSDGKLKFDELLVPLRGADGKVAGICAAVPFLRGSDVLALVPPKPPVANPESTRGAGDYLIPRPLEPVVMPEDLPDPLIEGMRTLHEELFAAARARLQPGQALVAMAHGYLVGGALSELSERKVLGGNQHALPLDLFPADCAYVALGHLHRPQQLAGHEHVRYSGSPIPLSMPEREHAHHVVFADLNGAQLEKVWSLRVPRLVPLLRIPERGELEPQAALAAVAQLPPREPKQAEELRPLLEVAVRLPEPAPSIGEQIARACAEKNVRLVRVEVVMTGSAPGAERDTAGPPVELASLRPEDVFVRRYQRDHEGPVPEPLLTAFRELLDSVENGAAEVMPPRSGAAR
ncbi:MAG: exonuclease SbcCD subunit D C-terminal domain-containing protein [Planctomycetes bacterium]|nr:exonuclease SbcCD subunit D C-terminal domain-containing protein [Planctomycetota bacterium]